MFELLVKKPGLWGNEKIGTVPIIIGRCMESFDIPRLLRAAATGFPHHVTQRRNYLERLLEAKNDFR